MFEKRAPLARSRDVLSNSLSGLRVLDFTQVAAGPLCTQTLVDLGAQVTKVEQPDGDLARQFSPYVEGQSVTFLALNSGKLSISRNLKDKEQRDTILELAAQADILVESFRPGVMERLGLGYDDIRKLNPGIIYCSVSAYGQLSPWRDKPGVDGVLQAVTGLMSVTGLPDAPPCKVQVPIVDVMTGYIATTAVLAALVKRDKDGTGEWLDISMFSSAMAMQQMAFATYFADGEVPQRLGSAAPYAAPNEALRCSDGWLMVAAYHPARWTALCQIIQRPELLQDERFYDPLQRIANRSELVGSLEETMVLRTRAEWQKLFEQADIICAPIADYAEVVASPAFTDNFLDVVEQPDAGALTFLRSPLKSVGEVPPDRTGAPRIGQHTDLILQGANAAAGTSSR